MESVFLKLVNMSITASWLVLAIILLRLVLRRVPKWVMCLLWGFAAIRLLVPISFESVFCLLPSVETIPNDFLMSREPEIESGIQILDEMINPIVTESLRPNPADSANPAQILTFVAANLWVIGIAAMLIYAGASLFLIKRKLREAVRCEGNIWMCDHVSTAFILGVFRPRVYLPSDLQEGDKEYVIAHERAHLKRGDHIWKPLGFALLAIYWFNPILWVAYILLCRDIELACDEKVIRKLGVEVKKNYSEALLRSSVSRKLLTVCPLAFGEVGVKERVRGVLNYKKPKFWIMVVAAAVCVVVAVCLLTNPLNRKIEDKKLEAFLRETIIDAHTSDKTEDNFIAVDWEIMKIEEKSQKTSIYMWVLCEEYKFDSKEEKLSVESAAHTPSVISVEKNGDSYELAEYWVPKDGSEYGPSIREKFPIYLWAKVRDIKKNIDAQQRRCLAQAQEYFRTVEVVDVEKPENIEGTADAENPVNLDGIVNVDKPINVTNPVDGDLDFRRFPEAVRSLEELREEYPEYFGLNAEDGLCVYVWQLAENHYCCGLLESMWRNLTDDEISLLWENPVNFKEMNLILSTYDIEKDEVEVAAYQMPHSSYIYEVKKDYYDKICRWVGIYDSEKEREEKAQKAAQEEAEKQAASERQKAIEEARKKEKEAIAQHS